MRSEARREFQRRSFRAFLPSMCGTECVNCGSTKNIEYHHIVPLVAGGTNRYSNIVPLCGECHGKIHGLKSCHKRGEGAGRPRNEAPLCYEAYLREFIRGRITYKECHDLLELPKSVKFYDKWYYREYLKEKGIVKIIKSKGQKRKESLIAYKDGSAERFVYVNGKLVEHQEWKL